MKSVSYLLAAGAALALSLGTLQSAKANTFEFVNAGDSDTVNIKVGTSSENVYAGAYNIKIDGTALVGFCTAVRNNIANGDTTTAGTYFSDITATAALPSAGYIDNVNHTAAQNAAAVAWITSTYLNDTNKTNRTNAALAIWSVVNNGNDNVITGDFQVTDVGYQAGTKSIVDAAYLNTTTITNVAWERTPKLTDGSTKYQDFAIDPIPEPAFYQMGAFLTGGGLLALRLRKRK